ncbi:biotin--[acetyl-CoA-carboxylase] ligase [Ulvibacter litoralis]|uniref:BirA family transcriptional regulator, biotin operon repressor / biotin-[acetyl-CoA-carboxylase] ligase n=1 Tax=Ulvibacter litoralis TaxID=227084 RepID=A0A1G7GL42_9FLAO|nr:biotin--[acetyl-CoA-carboxylase] ligase [Ulvibacter litoralis]GHC55772.1 biotin--[acetyl-CoA-carboxylase] ligase [Ulvibacter litoralis]SDE88857.1 BirA family transcriptional regulator, biotin operon repressor / biotin-[acetyl-CoA-carboxylase] ligase [Ulvibacter litoralis]
MKIIKLNAIDSTNTYLKDLSRNVTVQDGTIVTAEAQTQGRGQMGSKWQSKTGRSLTFSVFKRFHGLPITQQPMIAFAVALALQKALQKLQIPMVSIKWPNDIMSYQKKICGILIENQLEGSKVIASVVGIGLNVNETEFIQLPQATSMRLASGIQFNLDEVLVLVSEEVFRQLQALDEGNSEVLKQTYEASLFRRNKVTAFESKDGVQFNGIIKGVADTGELLLEIEDESLQKYEVKQLKMLF